MTPTPIVPDSTVAQWAIVMSLFMPFVTAVILQCHWSTGFKAVVAFLVCVAASAIQLGIQGKLDMLHLGSTSILMAATSATLFRNYFKDLATRLEIATTPGAGKDGAA